MFGLTEREDSVLTSDTLIKFSFLFDVKGQNGFSMFSCMSKPVLFLYNTIFCHSNPFKSNPLLLNLFLWFKILPVFLLI